MDYTSEDDPAEEIPLPQTRLAAVSQMSGCPPIPALTRNGYTRPARAEADIRRASALRDRELVAAFSISDEQHPDHLTAESLVFFIRRELSAGDPKTAEGLFTHLITRSQQVLRSMLRGVDEEARYDVQAEVLADLTRLILSKNDSGDFLQTRFWLYLRRRASTASAAWLRDRRVYVQEDDADSADRPDEQPVTDELSPEDKALVRDSLRRLPLDLRELVVLRHYEGWRVGDETQRDEKGTEPTLAERYGITPRAVRKRLAKAEALLTRDQREET